MDHLAVQVTEGPQWIHNCRVDGALSIVDPLVNDIPLQARDRKEIYYSILAEMILANLRPAPRSTSMVVRRCRRPRAAACGRAVGCCRCITTHRVDQCDAIETGYSTRVAGDLIGMVGERLEAAAAVGVASRAYDEPRDYRV